MNDLSRKRFVRSLRAAQESLARDAFCFRYDHDPDYLAVKEDLKFAIRLLEEGEDVAVRLLRRKLKQEFAGLDLQEWWECPMCGLKLRNQVSDELDTCPNCGLDLTNDQ